MTRVGTSIRQEQISVPNNSSVSEPCQRRHGCIMTVSVRRTEVSVNIALGVAGLQMSGAEDLEQGMNIVEYSGEHITMSTAISRRLEKPFYQDNPDYILGVNGGSVLIDTYWTGRVMFVNNGCSPNARLVTVPLRDGSYDIKMVESILRIPARTEVLVSYGWVYDSGDTIIIVDCGASNCCGVI